MNIAALLFFSFSGTFAFIHAQTHSSARTSSSEHSSPCGGTQQLPCLPNWGIMTSQQVSVSGVPSLTLVAGGGLITESDLVDEHTFYVNWSCMRPRTLVISEHILVPSTHVESKYLIRPSVSGRSVLFRDFCLPATASQSGSNANPNSMPHVYFISQYLNFSRKSVYF